MIFHVSIEADDPRRTASALAQIWGGAALPFPPVGVGSWAVIADDGRGSMIEVYPRGTELHEGAGARGAFGLPGVHRRHGPFHLAIGTNLDAETITAIARSQGWTAKYCRREDRFGLIEVWIDGCLMLEVLTPEMQREYLDTVTIDNWRAMLAAMPLSAAA
jgi:hypothetical protein